MAQPRCVPSLCHPNALSCFMPLQRHCSVGTPSDPLPLAGPAPLFHARTGMLGTRPAGTRTGVSFIFLNVELSSVLGSRAWQERVLCEPLPAPAGCGGFLPPRQIQPAISILPAAPPRLTAVGLLRPGLGAQQSRICKARFAAVAKNLGYRSNSHLQTLHWHVLSVPSVSPGMSTALWCKHAAVVSTELRAGTYPSAIYYLAWRK